MNRWLVWKTSEGIWRATCPVPLWEMLAGRHCRCADFETWANAMTHANWQAAQDARDADLADLGEVTC